jgi:excisionase family DNA binding protein
MTKQKLTTTPTTTTTNNEQIYTVKSLCAYLELTERTVTDLLRSGRLKGYKVFNKWLVTHSDLLAYVTAQKSNE